MNEWEITLSETEAGLTAEAQSDARLTFEEAFSAHQRLVYRYAYGLTRERALAEDVTQEVFIRLHSQLDTAQRAGMLRAWLLRVTANVARNLMRTGRRAAARDEAFAMEMFETADMQTPDEAFARRVEIEKTQRTLDRIKEPLRSCLLLRHEGLTYREIATALGLRESNVGSLIARARRKFTKLYMKVR